MDLEAALYTQLKNHTGLAALVGTRIYPDFIPQSNTQDALCFRLEDTETVHTMGSDTSLEGVYYKISCFGTTKSQARAVATQVKAALRDFSGVMGGDGGVTVQRIFLEDEYDEEAQGTNSDPKIKTRNFRVLEFLIWYHV